MGGANSLSFQKAWKAQLRRHENAQSRIIEGTSGDDDNDNNDNDDDDDDDDNDNQTILLFIYFFNCLLLFGRLLKLSLSMEKDLPQCYLLSPDGNIEEVLVPFHCALK